MSNIKILKTTEEKTELYTTVYIEDIKRAYHLYDSALYIWDITDALRLGKIVKEYIFSCKFRNQLHLINDIFNLNTGLKFKDLLLNPESVKFNLDEIKLSGRVLKSIDVFTPFYKVPNDVSLLKAKYNLGEIKKMLMNGQIKKVTTKMELSDDYKYDNDCNFQKNREIDKACFLKELVEYPSGWWVSKLETDKFGRRYIDVNCHQFRYERCWLDKDEKNNIDKELKINAKNHSNNNMIERSEKVCDEITALIIEKYPEFTWTQANEYAKKIFIKTLDGLSKSVK